MDGLLGVAGMIITSDYGSFPHSLLSTSKFMVPIPKGTGYLSVVKWKHDAVPHVVVNLG